jgi:phosphate transport system permease protein
VALLGAARDSILHAGFGFLVSTTWDPVRNIYGAAPFIAGTLLTSGLALLMAVPVALGVAIFLSDLAPVPLREPLAYAVDLLAAVPSIVYGFWAVFVLVPVMEHQVEPALGYTTGGRFLFAGSPLGLDVLTASIVLAIMILPTISAISRESMQAVSRTQREVALSLGATRWEATRIAVLGPARSGILGGVLLGLGRAVGETIAVTLTIGNINQIPGSLFAPGQTIASLIANDLTSAGPPETSALIEVGLVLLGITILINIAARLLIHRIRRGGDGSETLLEGSRRVLRRTGVLARLGPRHLADAAPAPSRPAAALPSAAADARWRERVRREFPARLKERRARHFIVLGLTVGCAILAIAPLVSIVYTAARLGGAAVIRPTFYTESMAPPCNPDTQSSCSIGGIGPAIEGTLVLIALSAAIAVPLGVMAGIYLAEYGRNRFARSVSFFTEVMTGLPSILIGTFVFVLFLALDRSIVASAISGSVALAILMLPLVSRTTEESLKSVPTGVRESALALGFPKHWVTLRVTLGCARAGIVTGILLASARAGGETAALLLTAQGFQYYSQGLDHPIGALPLVIFNYGQFGYPNWQADAWGATLVLLVIMLVISLVTRLAFRRHTMASEIG